MLLGVFRGSFSEGYDFSDHDARCVIIIGMPFPNLSDIKLIMQRHYLDQKKSELRYNYRDTYLN